MHYRDEQAFWDQQGVRSYSVLSAEDERRLCRWIYWQGQGVVLDLGGGSGAISRLLLREPNTSTVCLDISHKMVRHAPGMRVQADALRLPFANSSFSLIIAAALFHHLPGKETVLLEECERVLKPGGRLVGYDPNGSCIQNRLFMTDGPLRLGRFSPDELPIVPEHLGETAKNAGFIQFEASCFSFTYQKLTAFEIAQRFLINPLARGRLAPYLHRWFFWRAVKPEG